MYIYVNSICLKWVRSKKKKNYINKQRIDIERLYDEKLWRVDLYFYEIIKFNF